MKSKNLLSIAFIIMLIATLGLTYAYWDGLSKDDESYLEIGVGTKVIVDENLSDNESRLIPEGALLGTNEVYRIVKEYDVVLSKIPEHPLYLNVVVSKILVGNKEYDGLVNIDLLYNPTISNLEKVKLIVSMNNLDMDYSMIYHQDITFSVEFSVVNNNN